MQWYSCFLHGGYGDVEDFPRPAQVAEADRLVLRVVRRNVLGQEHELGHLHQVPLRLAVFPCDGGRKKAILGLWVLLHYILVCTTL